MAVIKVKPFKTKCYRIKGYAHLVSSQDSVKICQQISTKTCGSVNKHPTQSKEEKKMYEREVKKRLRRA
jgi:hypothetical protein